MSTYLGQLWAIVSKDLLLEFRTRERIAAMGAFAVLAGVLFNYSIDTTTTRPEDVAAGLIWMTMIFGGLLGVGRTFHLEEQDGAFMGMLTSPTPKDAVYLGKTLSNFVLLYVVALLVLGVFALFFGVDLGPNVVVVALVLGLVVLRPFWGAPCTHGAAPGPTMLPAHLRKEPVKWEARDPTAATCRVCYARAPVTDSQRVI